MGTIISILREIFNYWSYNATDESNQRQTVSDEPDGNGREPEQTLDQSPVDMDTSVRGQPHLPSTGVKLGRPKFGGMYIGSRTDEEKAEIARLEAHFDEQKALAKKARDDLEQFNYMVHNNREFQEQIKMIFGMIYHLVGNAGNDGLTRDEICNGITSQIGEEFDDLVDVLLFSFMLGNEKIVMIDRKSTKSADNPVYILNRDWLDSIDL